MIGQNKRFGMSMNANIQQLYNLCEYLLVKEKGVARFGTDAPGDYMPIFVVTVSMATLQGQMLQITYYSVHQDFTNKNNVADSLVIEYTDMPSEE